MRWLIKQNKQKNMRFSHHVRFCFCRWIFGTISLTFEKTNASEANKDTYQTNVIKATPNLYLSEHLNNEYPRSVSMQFVYMLTKVILHKNDQFNRLTRTLVSLTRKYIQCSSISEWIKNEKFAYFLVFTGFHFMQ